MDVSWDISEQSCVVTLLSSERFVISVVEIPVHPFPCIWLRARVISSWAMMLSSVFI